MLTCPICNQQVSEREMQEGRCPECMGLLSWQGFETDSHQEALLDEFPSASDSAPDPTAQNPDADQPAVPPPTAIPPDIQTEVEQPAEVPDTPAYSASDPGESLTPKHSGHSPSQEDTNQDIPAPSQADKKNLPGPGPADRSIGLEQTLQSQLMRSVGESRNIAQTIAPRELSAEELGQIDEEWETKGSDTNDINASLDPNSTSPGNKSSLVVKPRAVGGVHESQADGNDYQMMEALGKGGVGVVYSARQASIDRKVALKMLHPHLSQNEEYRNKFLAEAVVIGDLDHPQIVPIYDLGKNANDELFYTMKKVEGTPWSQKLDKLTLEENLDILLKICNAIAFAHFRGVIHRDLKPDNVMLGDFGEVLVMDWGLALVTEESSKRATIMGSDGLGGTPAYMAPEMVTGPIARITDRSDIYLLGALLFRILTGKTPHLGKNVKECVKAAAKNLLQPTEVRGELIEIALTAMATRPEDRYASALEFRDALKSFEAHAESLKLTAQAEKDLANACQDGDYQRFARSVFGFEEAIALWGSNSGARNGQLRAREKYAQAALSNGDFDLGLSVLDREETSHLPLVKKLESEQTDRDTRQRQLQRTKQVFRWATFSFVLMLFLACVVIYTKMQAARSAEAEAKTATITAEKEAGKARTAEGEAKSTAVQLENAYLKLEDKQENLRLAKESADRAREQAERSEKAAQENRKLAEAQTYLSQIALAAKKIEENRFDEAREILGVYQGSSLVGWEWGHLWDRCNLAEADQKLATVLQDVSNSHDGKLFAVAADDGLVRIWNTREFREQQGAPIWADAPRPGSDASITSVEFSPESELLAVGDSQGIVSLLKVSANAEIERLLNLPTPWGSQAPIPISSIRFSYSENQADPSDRTRWLLVGSESGEAAIWNLETEAWLQFPRGSTLRGHRREIRDIAASPDRRYILTAGEDDKIQIWSNDPSDASQPVSKVIAPNPAQPIEAYEISKTVYWMHEGAVLCLDAIVDDEGNLLIVSGGRDGSIHIWNLDDVPKDNLTTVPPRTTVRPRANNSAVQDVRFFRGKSGKGDHTEINLLACGDDRIVQLWTVNQQELFTYRSSATPPQTDRKTPVATLKHQFRGHGGRITACTPVPWQGNREEPDPSEPLIVSVGEDQRVMLWNQADYSEQDVFELETEAQILDATFDHDSDQIASVTSRGVLSITNLLSNQSARVKERELSSDFWKEGHDYLANRGQFVPSDFDEPERWFVSAGIDGKVIVWDLERGVSIREYDQSGRTSIIALAPDRKRIVTGGPGNSAVLGDLPRVIIDPSASETNTGMIELSSHKDLVTAACFSSDGRWILTADKQGEVCVWPNAAELSAEQAIEPVFSTRAHSEEITGIHSLGESIITTSRDYSIKIWSISESSDSPNVKLTLDRRLRGTGEVTESSVSRGRYLACVRQRYDKLETQESSETQTTAQVMMTSEIIVYDLNSDPPREWPPLMKENRQILATDFFQDRDWLLLTDNNGKVSLWDWETGQDHPLPFDNELENFCTRVDASGTRLVTTGGRQIQLWNFDPTSKELLSIQATLGSQRLLGPHYGISRVSFSDDDSWIVTGDRNGHVKLWQRPAEENGYHLQYRLPIRTDRSIVAARFSPRSPNILLTAWEDLLVLWKYDGQQWVEQKRKSIKDNPGISFAEFSPSGRKLLLGRYDGDCELWNPSELIREVQLRGSIRHELSINCAAFSADERLIVTGSDDKSARGILWKLDRGEWSPAAKIAGHSGGITSVAFSPIHQLRLLTGSRDGTAKLWDISQWTATSAGPATGASIDQVTIKELLTLRKHNQEVTAVDFDHTGRYLLTASRDGKTIRWSSAQIDPAVVTRLDSLEMRPGQPVHLCQGFEILDPVSPRLAGGTLSLNVRPSFSALESGDDVPWLSLKLEAGDFLVEKSTENNQRELILQSSASATNRRRIGTVVQGAVGESELSLPLEIQIDPGTTHLELMGFLNHLVCTPPVIDQQTGQAELVLTLRLEHPQTESDSPLEASLTLRIILPESESKISEPASVE